MKFLTVSIIMLFACFNNSCKWNYDTSENKSFDADLRGTWTSNDPSVFSGVLSIDLDRITITGYAESQTPAREDDNKRPFRGFTRGTALKGYSEEGKIFIEDAGMLREGIPYLYWDDSPPPGFLKIKFLRFNFGGSEETLQCH